MGSGQGRSTYDLWALRALLPPAGSNLNDLVRSTYRAVPQLAYFRLRETSQIRIYGGLRICNMRSSSHFQGLFNDLKCQTDLGVIPASSASFLCNHILEPQHPCV